MNALLVLLLSCAAIVIGYGWYAKRIDHSVIQPDDRKATPA
jgi:carbon starvation protein CstA